MSEFRSSFCTREGCGVEICWCVTTRGNRMPVDWDGDLAGEFWVVHNDERVGGNVQVPLAVHRSRLTKSHRKMRKGPRKSHFATCANPHG